MDFMNKCLFVVEGAMDVSKLKSIGIKYVVKTNGLAINRDTYEFLKLAQKQRRIIIVTDPDNPGTIIRQKLQSVLGSSEAVKIEKEMAKGKRKLGVAETNIEYLKSVLKPYTDSDAASCEKDTLCENDLIDLKLIGFDSHKRRLVLKQKFFVRISSGKTLLEDLNILKLTKDQISKELEI